MVETVISMRADLAANVLGLMPIGEATSILAWMVYPYAARSCCLSCRRKHDRGTSIGAGVAGDIMESFTPETAAKILHEMVRGDPIRFIEGDLEAAASILHYMTFPSDRTGAIRHAMPPDSSHDLMAQVEAWEDESAVPPSIAGVLPEDHPLRS